MKEKFYIGIDVGGTKISLGVVTEDGCILARSKKRPERRAKSKEIVCLIEKLIGDVLSDNRLNKKNIIGVGVGVPGLVDTASDRIIATPNIDLAGADVAGMVRKRFAAKAYLGNDANLGVLGEAWLGAKGARRARNAVGLFWGTGLGGGVIVNGKLLSGCQGAASEVGHMVLCVNGPVCSCGNRGCLESYVGRWAIERDIRKALGGGKKSIITDLAGKKLTTIKSKFLFKALRQKDPVVVAVMKNAARMLGVACVSLCHIFDPEVFILGGGVVEACGDYVIGVVRDTIEADPFFKKLKSCRVVPSGLGDDAIILGAVALVKGQSI